MTIFRNAFRGAKAEAVAAALVLGFATASGASAQNDDPVPFVTPDAIDLLQLLPPPPADDPEKTQVELATVLALQEARTPESEARCVDIDLEDVWVFAEVLGPDFSADKLPLTSAFYSRVGEFGEIFRPARNALARQPPFQFSELVIPVGERSSSFGYPSGTATQAALYGLVLSNMLPEKRAELMELAWEIGDCRVVLGFHYPSDVEAGRMTGALLAQAMMSTDEFETEFEGARNELVAAVAPK